jgi:ABC-type transport system involved in multi-copper enzyme maturation permease subunit
VSDQPAAAALPETPRRRWAPFQWLADNPIIMKELRGRMRGRGAFLLVTGYLALIGLVIGVIYATLAGDTYYYSPWDPQMRQSIGKAIFGTVVMMELFLVSLIGPALTSGAITSERERQTLEILRSTTLPARALVLGKLGSAAAFLLLLIFTALPIESIAFVLGGVGLGEIVVSSLLLVITAVFHCALGLFFSSILKRTSTATVSSYASIVLSYVLIVVIFLVMLFIGTSPLGYALYGPQSIIRDFVIEVMIWLLVCSNPLLAAAVSEAVLVDNQSLFLTSSSFLGSSNLVLPSPWIIFTLIYGSMAVVLVAISIHRVSQPDR